jgi:putative hydrolase of the HAD superfamily
LQQVQTALFDLDDTLVAFDAVTESSWHQVCAVYCAENLAVSKEKLYATIQRHSSWYWSSEERHRIGRLDIISARRQFVGAAFEELGLPPEDAVAVADRYSRVRIDNMYLVPGALETLSRLHGRGMKLGMVTNGDSLTQRGKIQRFGLEKYFTCIMVEGEVGFGKPDERIFTRALQELKSKPGETVMIGDNLQWDIAGPQAVGIRGIWHNWKGIELPKEKGIVPDGIIRRLPELFDLF